MHESEQTIDPNFVPKCRICWQESSATISPCNCSGTMARIHEQCLKVWIEKSVERGSRHTVEKENGYSSITCQLCKGDIIFKMSKKPACLKCVQVRQKIKQNKGSFFVLLCVILGMAIIGIVLLTQGITDLISGVYTIWGIIFVFAFVVLIFALQIRFLISFVNTFFRGNSYNICDFKKKNSI